MVPKTIWCLWFQGWEHAPPLVRACAASWRHHNPDWSIRYLTRSSLPYYVETIENFIEKNIPITALSDIIRVSLLCRFGGVWADSTVYCLRPLNEWINYANSSGFFAFDRPGADRMLSSWFLAAKHQSRIVELWHKQVSLYWESRQGEPDDYFWFHNIFSELYNMDAEFQKIWDATPKLAAEAPHCFQPCDEHLFGPVTPFHRLIVDTAQLPLIKLSHKIDHERAGPGTTYQWLCARTPPFSASGYEG
jgi:hypothetical protein